MSCTLSLCMIAKDEEEQIARCINSAKGFVDQIIVVDTGSTDRTVEIARELGAEVYHLQWQDDFSQARNESLKYAKGDWIIVLDCDEELDQNSALLLKEAINRENYSGYWLTCINIINGKPQNKFPSFRLFRNKPHFRYECPIHEQILPAVLKHTKPEQIGKLDVYIYHYGYEVSTVKQHNKIERNIRILQKAREQYGNAGFVNYYLGVEYQRANDYQTALHYYLQSLAVTDDQVPYKPSLIKNIGHCYLHENKPQAALKVIDRYLDVYPDYADLIYLKGVILLQLDQYQQALACMNACLAMKGAPDKYINTLGITDYLPKQFINKLIAALIQEARRLILKQTYGNAFDLLNIVFNQLKKTPSETAYLRLLETMHYLIDSLNKQQSLNLDDVQLSICIVCFNAVEYTKRCVQSIRQNTDIPYKIHLLDNGSTDDTKKYLESIKNDADIEVFFSAVNLGAAKGRNLLIKQAKLYPYVVFLDNDVEVFAHWYLPFFRQLQANPSLGILGVQGYKVKVRGKTRYLTPVKEGRADIITGYCMFTTKELINYIGLFDEHLGRYWHEDDDYCLRAIGAGYFNQVVAADLVHYGSKSSSTEPDMLDRKYSQQNLAYLTEKWRRLGLINAQGKPHCGKINLAWEGQFADGSLAHVNREIALQLCEHPALNLKLVRSEAEQFNAPADPPLDKITKLFVSRPPTNVNFYVRHQWPPNFQKPPAGKWILMQPWEYGAIPKNWVKPMVEEIDEIWVPSTFNKQCYVECGIPEEKVYVIPNGVNTEIFCPGKDKFPLKTAKRFKFGFVGGTIWRKGIDILLNAYLQAFNQHDDVSLIIKDHGTNSFYRGQTLSDYIKELRKNPNHPEIIYISDQLSTTEMVQLYRAIDCLVHPYRGEGFGLPIAEAMACEKPVIVTDYGAALDFCDKNNSFLIPATVKVFAEKFVGDLETVTYPYIAEPKVDKLSEILREVYHLPPEKLAQMGRSGRKRILNQFTWRHTADAIMKRLEG